MTTIPAIVLKNGKIHPDKEAYFVKKNGLWVGSTWDQYAGLVRRAAKSLLAHGYGAIKRFCRVEKLSLFECFDAFWLLEESSPQRVVTFERFWPSSFWVYSIFRSRLVTQRLVSLLELLIVFLYAKIFWRHRLRQGEATAILGANRPEWVIFDVATMAIGAVPAGIYATSSPVEVWSESKRKLIPGLGDLYFESLRSEGLDSREQGPMGEGEEGVGCWTATTPSKGRYHRGRIGRRTFGRVGDVLGGWRRQRGRESGWSRRGTSRKQPRHAYLHVWNDWTSEGRNAYSQEPLLDL